MHDEGPVPEGDPSGHGAVAHTTAVPCLDSRSGITTTQVPAATQHTKHTAADSVPAAS